MKFKSIIILLFSIIVIMCSCTVTKTNYFSHNKNTVSESSPTDYSPTELALTMESIWRNNSTRIIETTRHKLIKKGWKNIEISEGYPGFEEWEYSLLVPTESEKEMFTYTIWGNTEGLYNNAITVVVKIVFNEENPDGKIYGVYYISESGRDIAVDSDILETDSAGIVEFNNKALWNYMYSY